MTYVVIEIQKYLDGTIGIPPVNTYTDKNEAEARYHTILSIAATSNVPVHTVVILNEQGYIVKRESYTHATIPTE